MSPHTIELTRPGFLLADNRMRWGLGIATLLFLVAWQMPAPSITLHIDQFAPWHTLLEIFAIVVAGAVFAVGWHARSSNASTSLTLLATTFLAVALFDTSHMLSYAGMPDWISASGPNKSIQFWLLGRYTAALALFAFVANVRPPAGVRASHALLISLVFALVSIAFLLEFGPELMPFFIPGTGLTPLKINLEWGLILIQSLTLLLVWQQGNSRPEYEPKALLTALFLATLSELCFTLYSSVTDIFSILGHVYKAAAYVFLFQSLMLGAVKRPYQMLSESQALLQQLTDNIRQVFWMTSADKKSMLYISPAYQEIWGRTQQSLMERPLGWIEAIHPDDRGRVQQALTTQDNGEYNIEYRVIRPNGSIRWVHDQAFPVRDENGRLTRIAGVAEDITDQKEAAAMVAANESRLRAILKTASEGIHILSAEGVLVDASDSFLESIGHDEHSLGKIHVWDWDKEIPKDEVLSNLRQAIASGQPHLFETHHQRRNGETFPVEIFMRAFRIGTADMVYAASRDLTDRKATEIERQNLQNQLQQAQKMESIGHLTGGIAHDFNNILGAILGYAELLRQMGMANSPEERNQRYVSEIYTAGLRAKELISQMLMFSRLTPEVPNGDIPVTLLQPVVKEVVHLLRSSIPSTVEVNFHRDMDSLRARVHPVQLHQILLNLTINARDAIDEYGRIDIYIKRHATNGVCHSCHQPFSGDFVEITVTDNGRGIPSHVLPKIFDPFYTTKEVGKGTGMGLSVVHGILHATGGHVLVESTVGTGTIMKVYLPAAAPDNTEPDALVEQAAAQHTPLSGMHIMVVDDEQSMAGMLEEMLRLQGADVTAFTRPAQALAAFERTPRNFDLVITDETMPELSGLDMARSMRHIRPDQPVILCTGFSERVDEALAMQNGIAAFLYKPIDIHALLSWIEKIQQDRAHPPQQGN